MLALLMHFENKKSNYLIGYEQVHASKHQRELCGFLLLDGALIQWLRQQDCLPCSSICTNLQLIDANDTCSGTGEFVSICLIRIASESSFWSKINGILRMKAKSVERFQPGKSHFLTEGLILVILERLLGVRLTLEALSTIG